MRGIAFRTGRVRQTKQLGDLETGKDMGFVDYLSRHPSGEPVPVSLDDDKFAITSVN